MNAPGEAAGRRAAPTAANPAPAGKVLMLCADDFGLSPAISQGIAALARQGRLSAVGCVTNSAHWHACAPLLAALPPSIERGLHWNLTEGAPLSPALRARWPALPRLPWLIALAHLRRLPLAALRDELQAQLDAFAAATGAPPRFLDGHQHVHHLPGLRELVAEAAAGAHPPLAVRNTAHVAGPGDGLKRLLIERTGGAALARLLRARGLAHNAVLLGAYDFRQADFRGRMRAWLAAVPAEGGLLFCHPGAAPAPGAAPSDDPIAAARLREADYLGSEAFAQDLAEAGVSLGPAWRQRSSRG